MSYGQINRSDNFKFRTQIPVNNPFILGQSLPNNASFDTLYVGYLYVNSGANISGINLTGAYWGDYLYWDGNDYAVGSQNITLGRNAGEFSQGLNAVALGASAGTNDQGAHSVAIGVSAGENNQSPNSIAIGSQAAQYLQGQNSIALGYNAGYFNQGSYSIAIGNEAGVNTQASNSIIINATPNVLDSSTSGFFVDPINENNIAPTSLFYDPVTKEITYGIDRGNTGATGAPGYSSGEPLYLEASTLVLNPLISTGPEVSITTTISPSSSTSIISLTTPPWFPNATSIPGGIWSFNIFCKTNYALYTYIQAKIFLNSITGPLLSTSNEALLSNNEIELITLQAAVATTSISPTDLIVVQLIGRNEGGSAGTITTYYEGTEHYSNIISSLHQLILYNEIPMPGPTGASFDVIDPGEGRLLVDLTVSSARAEKNLTFFTGVLNLTGTFSVSDSIIINSSGTINYFESTGFIFNDNIIPSETLTYNLGANDKLWNNLFVNEIDFNVTGSITSNGTGVVISPNLEVPGVSTFNTVYISNAYIANLSGAGSSFIQNPNLGSVITCINSSEANAEANMTFLNNNLLVTGAVTALTGTLKHLTVADNVILSSRGTARKLYSLPPTPITGSNPPISITFGNYSFYAKVQATLCDMADYDNVSTLLFDIVGGNYIGAVSSKIARTANLAEFHTFPNTSIWNLPATSTTYNSVTFSPSISGNYYFNINIELQDLTGNSTVQSISQNSIIIQTFDF